MRFFTKLSIPSGLALTFLLAPPALAASIDASTPGAFVGSLAVAAVGIGGGVALLLLIYGGLMFSLSRGDPTKVQEAGEIITNALGGLALIVFATLILRIVGKDILDLPGFPDIAI
jgi:hypothetical protein